LNRFIVADDTHQPSRWQDFKRLLLNHITDRYPVTS
jgi:hypothetical protein